MKIGIVTLHNSYNFGSVLQAFATQKTLVSFGHQPEILNLDTLPYVWKRNKLLISKDPRRLLFNLRRAISYISIFRKMHICKVPYSKRRVHYDAVVIGGDELWNVHNRTFYRAPEFFGIGIDSERIIAYAVSCGESKYEDLVNYPGACDGLRRMRTLSVRDDNTLDVVQQLTGRMPPKVLDPPFLVDLTADEEPTSLRNFILVYAYRFSPSEVQATVEFARRQGKPLISAGFCHDWCDSSIVASPLQFLGLIHVADYVITNTFHGTVFSIIYRKAFGTFTSNKIKVQSLLNDLGLAGRALDEHADIQEVVCSDYDRAALTAVLAERRATSLAYLEGALAGDHSDHASVVA